MKYFIFLIYLLSVLLSCRTDLLSDLVDTFEGRDKSLIRIETYRSLDLYQVEVKFSKRPYAVQARLDGEKMQSRRGGELSVILTSQKAMSLSGDNELHIIAEDQDGNTASFILEVGGVNANIPALVINEFSSRGSDTQPERIELEIRSDGNTEGVYVADGMAGYENWGYTLPSLDVKRGDYIVIYWTVKPEKSSYANESSSTTYNLYAASPSGLGDNNGVFVVKETKSGDAEVIDALIYSDFGSTTYSGFGNAKTEKSVNILKEEFAWFDAAVNYSNGTTTRTLNRRTGAADTDTALDFFICQTRCQTFGNMNTTKEYIATAGD